MLILHQFYYFLSCSINIYIYIYEKIKVLSKVYFETLSEFIFLLNYKIII